MLLHPCVGPPKRSWDSPTALTAVGKTLTSKPIRSLQNKQTNHYLVLHGNSQGKAVFWGGCCAPPGFKCRQVSSPSSLPINGASGACPFPQQQSSVSFHGHPGSALNFWETRSLVFTWMGWRSAKSKSRMEETPTTAQLAAYRNERTGKNGRALRGESSRE